MYSSTGNDGRLDNRQGRYFFLIMFLMTILLFILSFRLGYYDIPTKDVLKVLFAKIYPIKHTWPDEYEVIIINLRLPRIIAAMLVGAALSMAGAVYQGMFQNPLASPDILGVSSGAGFGAALAISMGLSYQYVQVSAFVFGLGVVGVAYSLAGRIRYGQIISLILAGAILGSLCSAGITLLKYLADTVDRLPAITFWLMGSLASVYFDELYIAIIPMMIGLVIIVVMRWRINVLTLGDEEARSLGINPRNIRLLVITGATLLSASAVCIAGIIGWIGLIVPHIIRYFTGPEYSRLIPGCLLGGAFFLLVVDNLARTLSTMEIPLGVLIAIVGAPFLLNLIIQEREW
ncbi:MAG: iron ABC transporter permease [Bacillota bacterium]